jgi:DNA invertase Pin-like site-specific DNA recombinase
MAKLEKPTEADTAAIYVRSGRPDKTGAASDLKLCQEFIRKNGWTTGEAYIEFCQANVLAVQRPQMQRLFADAAAGRFSRLVALEYKTIGAPNAFVSKVIQQLKRLNVTICYVNASGE